MYSPIKKIFLSVIINLSIITPLFAQKSIVGKVVNSESGQPVQGTHISTKKSDANSVADMNGVFNIHINQLSEDTLVINALGYKQVLIPCQNLSDTLIIKLFVTYFQLPEITVSTINNWNEFWSRIKLSSNNPFPSESETYKKVDFKINGNKLNASHFKALSHFEGFSVHGLSSYLRGKLFWYVVYAFQISDSSGIINYDGLPHSELFTDLDLGLFLWLLSVDTSRGGNRFGLGRNVFKGITNFGNDSVYVVEFYPEEDGMRENAIKFNRATSKFYSLFSAEKRFYIRKSDFQILRIDFKQSTRDPEPLLKENIISIKEISGSIGFQYYKGNIHPTYIYQYYAYTDKSGNSIERSDSTFFSDIQFIKLPERELKEKYQLAKVYKSFPIRSVSHLHKSRIGHFKFVPIKK
jgi:hypothetical protein